MEWLYLFLLLIGLFYAVIVGITGGIFGGDHAGGMDVDHDVGAHVDANASADHGTVHFSAFSPVVLATFIGTFGAAGLIALRVGKLPLYAHLPIALIAAFLVSLVALSAFRKIFSATQSTSQARAADLVGLEAEVLTGIPENGLGQIAYVIRGTRLTSPARAENGRAIPTGATVKIQKIVGDVLFVEKNS